MEEFTVIGNCQFGNLKFGDLVMKPLVGYAKSNYVQFHFQISKLNIPNHQIQISKSKQCSPGTLTYQ